VVVVLGFCGYYLASMLDFVGLQYVSASLERLILYLNPTLVLALSVLLYRKAVGARQLLALAVSYAGVLLVFGHEMEFKGSTRCGARCWCSAARSATRSTWCTAARRCGAWARCA
jgi:drug/metabolite transporter (DMT)-like permease